MSHLVARIMLALLMFPIGGLAYLMTVALAMEHLPLRGQETWSFLFASAVTWAFIAVYWILLWRGTVRWSPHRTALTITSGPTVVIFGCFGGALLSSIDRGLAIFVGGLIAIFLWLLATVFIWRETPRERADRFRGSAGVICPRCGYNLTGLRQTACPECGASFTVEELLGLQPGRDSEELE